MGMSMHVTLLRNREDTTYQKNLAVLLACKDANIDPPIEIHDYFGGEGDPEFPLEVEFNPRTWQEDMCNGFEVDIAELPEGVETVRFYVSY